MLEPPDAAGCEPHDSYNHADETCSHDLKEKVELPVPLTFLENLAEAIDAPQFFHSPDLLIPHSSSSF
jgi:hypothetical protein